jgi:hypothetical protein
MNTLGYPHTILSAILFILSLLFFAAGFLLFVVNYRKGISIRWLGFFIFAGAFLDLLARINFR